MLDDFVEKVKQQFMSVRVIKPDASRAKSSEVYVLATHFKPSETGQ
jgi:23S rRNA U2552 (ribose-2'-O)-methylase RlmE/FtsJ